MLKRSHELLLVLFVPFRTNPQRIRKIGLSSCQIDLKRSFCSTSGNFWRDLPSSQAPSLPHFQDTAALVSQVLKHVHGGIVPTSSNVAFLRFSYAQSKMGHKHNDQQCIRKFELSACQVMRNIGGTIRNLAFDLISGSF